MDSLYNVCLNGLDVGVDSEEAVYVFAESALYVLGATHAFDYQELIRPYCKDVSAKVFRLSLCEQRYASLNIKLYMVAMFRNGCASKQQAKKLAEKFEITQKDSTLMWLLYSSNDWFFKAASTKVKSLGRNADHLTVERALKTFNRLFPRVFSYIKFYTYKKMRFLVKSKNELFDDFNSEVSAKVVQAFYNLIPIDHSDDHIVNYLKRAAHNHVVNMIKSHQTQKRARMVSTNVGNTQFEMLCVSQNQMAPVEDGGQPDVDGEEDPSPKFELQFSISQVLDKVKAQTKKYKFITLLLGAECSAFSKWLRSKSLCKENEDNVDVQARVCSETYTRYVADFLKVSSGRVNSLFGSLRTQLAV